MTDKAPRENGELDAETLEASFAVIAPHGERLVERFYEELFDRFPTVQPMFADSDMRSQQAKLLAALRLVIANARNTDVLIPALQELGRRHENYGAQPDHYVAVASVLISVLAEIAAEQWTDQIQNAWCDALAVIAGVMIGGYSSVSPEASEEIPAGPPGSTERRSADRPRTGAKVAARAGDGSPAALLPKTARQR